MARGLPHLRADVSSRLRKNLACGKSGLRLLLGGAAVYRCDNRPVFWGRLYRLLKNSVSYQGIALAMPKILRNQSPL
jgi:hypothetical protein